MEATPMKKIFNPEAYDPPWGDFPHDPKVITPPAMPPDRWGRFLIWALLIAAGIFVAFVYVVTTAF